jgi:hypothetical protein
MIKKLKSLIAVLMVTVILFSFSAAGFATQTATVVDRVETYQVEVPFVGWVTIRESVVIMDRISYENGYQFVRVENYEVIYLDTMLSRSRILGTQYYYSTY